MKKKDLIYVVLAVLIIGVASYLALTQLSPKSANGANSGTVVDVIGPISDQLNQTALTMLQDPTKAVDYSVRIDFTVGLGNAAPFGR